MTAKIQSQPINLLDENFEPETMHPADIEQILIASFEEYQNIGKFDRIRKQYREAYNRLVDCLTDKRGFQQFSYLA